MNRVLILTPRFGSLSETFIYDQIVGVKEFNPVVCCYQGLNNSVFPFSGELVVLGTLPLNLVDRILSKVLRIWRKSHRFSIHYSAEIRIRRLLKKENIALIHCHYGETAIGIIPILQDFDIPTLVTFHGYDASKMLLDQEYCRKLTKLFNLKIHTVTVSKNMETRLLPFQLARERNSVIPCGVDINYFVKNTERKPPDGPLIILHSGRLTQKKGVLDLVKVFLEMVILNVVLWVIGDNGNEGVDVRREIEQFIQTNNLDKKVVLFGSVPRDSVRKMMQESDIFVLNSRISVDGDMEGLPVSILEAMACGLPVVSTIHAGIPEIIQDGVNGILVPEYDNSALKKAILTLVQDEKLRLTLSQNALRRSLDFNQPTIIKRIKDVYASLIAPPENNFPLS